MKTRIEFRRGRHWLAGYCLLATMAANAQTSSPAAHANGALPGLPVRRLVRTTTTSFGSRPLSFEANRGPDSLVAPFLAHGQGYNLALRPAEADFTLRAASALHRHHPAAQIKMRLAGSDPAAHFAAAKPLPGQVNYFLGNDPAKWRTHIPTFAQVRCNGVYPGVDIVYYGNQRQLEYDFVVAPKADLTAIRIEFNGAQKTRIAADGSLRVVTAAGELHWRKPVVYQEVGGKRCSVAARFTASNGKGRTIGFAVAAYDHNRPLIIDPTLIFSTYMGGFGTGNNGKEEGHAIAVDSSNNVYVTGFSASPDFPVPHATGPDVFVAKFSPEGTLLYLTYFGGEAAETANGIAVDRNGTAFITGITNSFTFPVTPNALQSAHLTPLYPTEAGYLTRLSADGGSLLYSTYICDTLSNYSATEGEAVTLDASGAAYVTGSTSAVAFPVRNAYQSRLGSSPTMFIAKYNTDASTPDASLVYATYVGGTAYGGGLGIAVDNTGAAYVGGYGSSDFTTTSNAVPPAAGGNGTIVIVKLSPEGNRLLYSTRFGGSHSNTLTGVALDANNSLYITGYTGSPDFPHTAHAYQTSLHRGVNAFVTKMDITDAGASLVYSTFLGSGYNDAWGIAVDGAGCAWIAGSTADADFPLALPIQSVNRSVATADYGVSNTYIARLSPDGSQLIFSTYLGGGGHDNAFAIALDSNRNALITGTTFSTDFPLRNATQSTLRGYTDIIIAKVQAQIADLELTHTASSSSIAGGDRVTFFSEIINRGPDDAPNVSFAETLTRAYDPDAPFDTVVVDGTVATHTPGIVTPSIDNHHLTALIPLLPANDRILVSLVVTTSRPISDGNITSAVTVSSAAADTNSGNNRPAPVTVVVTLPVTPHITTLTPNNATAGGPAFDLTVTGTNFRSGATVNWNGTARATTFVSASQLSAQIDAADIALAGTANITLTNPGGTISNAVPFFIGTPVLRASLYSVTRSGGFYHVQVQVRNVGTADAASVTTLGATLGGVSSVTAPLPALGTIAPGTAAFATLDFPLSTGASGSTAFLAFRAGYSAGILNSTQRVRLP